MRFGKYALAGLALSVAGVLVAAPFGEWAMHPDAFLPQRWALAWVSDSTPYSADGDGFRFIGIEGSYVPSSPEDVAMPGAFESLLLAQDLGRYEVWWSGFPFRSVCGWHVQAGTLDNGGPPSDVWHGVLPIPIRPPQGVIYIPFRPLWLGFLGNVAVYGLAVFLVVEFFRRWRRAFWRENGRCMGCGYELAGLPACPECGRAAAPARA